MVEVENAKKNVIICSCLSITNKSAINSQHHYLIWKPTDALNQVLIRLPITSNQLSNSRNHRKRVNIIAEKKGSKFEREQKKIL